MTEQSPVERIKRASRLLRGTLVESLADPLTGRNPRGRHDADQVPRQLPAGRSRHPRGAPPSEARACLQLHDPHAPARRRLHAGAMAAARRDRAGIRGLGLRITTRQAFQFHGVVKTELKTTMQALNAALIDTIAACGDVNRNVMVSANPVESTRASGRLRLGEAAVRASPAAHARVSRDLARRREDRRHDGSRADLRRGLPAAQVQDRVRRAAAQRRRCLCQRPGLHRHHRERRTAGLQPDASVAAWAPRTAIRRPTRVLRTWSDSCDPSRCSRSPKPC